MTELYFLDRTLAVKCGPIDRYVSLVWREQYGACGSYTLVLPMEQALFSAVLGADYLQVHGRVGLGRVEKVTYSGGDNGGTMTVSGRMAESLLSDRIIPRRTVVSGTLCRAVEAVVTANACIGERAIPCLTVRASDALLGDDGNPLTLEDHVTGRPMDEWLYEVLGAVGASYRIVPDFEAGTLVFEIYRGLDRTQAQTENAFAVFSASFSSAGEFQFVSDSGDHRNFAYIAGEGEGDDRVEVTLDLRTTPDEPRRELYIDARDLRSDDGETPLTAEEYRQLLLSRGRQRLASHAHVLTLGGSAAAYNAAAYVEEDGTEAMRQTAPAWGEAPVPIGGSYTSSMICGVHYALGDLCDIASEALGAVWSERVTAVTYIYEGSHVRVEPQFGAAYPDLRTFIRRSTEQRG